MIASNVSAEEAQDEVSVQGGWAYTARGDDGAVEHVAATVRQKMRLGFYLHAAPTSG